MAVNFFDLPPEVIEEIFKFLTKTMDRRRLALVCSTFYKIIRRQSQRNGQLKLTSRNFKWTPVSVFENSSIFPFAKIYIEGKFNLTPDSEFWRQNGMQIVEITMEYDEVNINRFLIKWSAYFPNLKTLRIVEGILKVSSIRKVNLPDLPLDIKELYVETDRLDLSTIQRLQHAAPSLKRLHLAVGDAKTIPYLLDWIESVEMVSVNAKEVSLANIETNLTVLPSKVIFTVLKVEAKSNDGPKILNEFLKTPRVVEILVVEWPHIIAKRVLMKEQIKLLLKANSVRHLCIIKGLKDCQQSLDLLAEQPGLETIELQMSSRAGRQQTRQTRSIVNRLWSNPSTAEKIRSIKCNGNTRLNFESLWAITSLNIYIDGACFTDGQLQALSRHCTNLKKLRMSGFEMNEARLFTIASLGKLEELEISFKPETTKRSFSSVFLFPKLKQLEVHFTTIDTDSVKSLVANCPNLERLHLCSGDRTIDQGFESLFCRLPYLMEIICKHGYYGLPVSVYRA